MYRVAIFIDGGYFLRRLPAVRRDVVSTDANSVSRAIVQLINSHLKQLNKVYGSGDWRNRSGDWRKLLYRAFYYDARPYGGKRHKPVTGQAVNYAITEQALFRTNLFELLRRQPNMMLRLGEVRKDSDRSWILKSAPQKAVLTERRTVAELQDSDFAPALRQKGVDMMLGIDMASIVLKRHANIVVLVSGDADFVPAAKLARREGARFILDPLWRNVARDLAEHVDGVTSGFPRPRDLAEHVA